jgi:hypothetical protein
MDAAEKADTSGFSLIDALAGKMDADMLGALASFLAYERVLNAARACKARWKILCTPTEHDMQLDPECTHETLRKRLLDQTCCALYDAVEQMERCEAADNEAANE